MQNKFDAIIFLVDYTSFSPQSEGENSYNLKLSGRTLYQWVETALGGASHEAIPYDTKVVLVNAVKQHCSAKRYTAVLFSDTPLVRNAALISAMEYMAKKEVACVRLARGFIFDNLRLDEAGDLEELPVLRHSGDSEDYFVVSDFISLAEAGKALRKRINLYHQQNGVNLVDPDNTYIDADVTIAPDVTIFPFNTIKGASRVEKGALVKEGNTIEDSAIGEGAVLVSSHIEGSMVNANASVGPFAHIRPKSVIGRHAKVGNFVEIKNSTIGNGTKVSHLSYIGDAIIEADCNIGCGVTVANYDGKKKNRTYIGEGAFVGSNSVLVAPLTVGARSLIAAGSVVTQDVDADALAIARARQVNKPDGAKKYLE